MCWSRVWFLTHRNSWSMPQRYTSYSIHQSGLRDKGITHTLARLRCFWKPRHNAGINIDLASSLITMQLCSHPRACRFREWLPRSARHFFSVFKCLKKSVWNEGSCKTFLFKMWIKTTSHSVSLLNTSITILFSYEADNKRKHCNIHSWIWS
jgi:hypothetical protein